MSDIYRFMLLHQIDELEKIKSQLSEMIEKVDSVINDVDDDHYFLYWKLF